MHSFMQLQSESLRQTWRSSLNSLIIVGPSHRIAKVDILQFAPVHGVELVNSSRALMVFGIHDYWNKLGEWFRIQLVRSQLHDLRYKPWKTRKAKISADELRFHRGQLWLTPFYFILFPRILHRSWISLLVWILFVSQNLANQHNGGGHIAHFVHLAPSSSPKRTKHLKQNTKQNKMKSKPKKNKRIENQTKQCKWQGLELRIPRSLCRKWCQRLQNLHLAPRPQGRASLNHLAGGEVHEARQGDATLGGELSISIPGITRFPLLLGSLKASSRVEEKWKIDLNWHGQNAKQPDLWVQKYELHDAHQSFVRKLLGPESKDFEESLQQLLLNWSICRGISQGLKQATNLWRCELQGPTKGMDRMWYISPNSRWRAQAQRCSTANCPNKLIFGQHQNVCTLQLFVCQRCRLSLNLRLLLLRQFWLLFPINVKTTTGFENILKLDLSGIIRQRSL